MAEYIHYEESKDGPRLYKFGKYSFSSIEIKHLSIALVLITLALMALQRHMISQIGIVNFVVLYFLTVGLGFLLHEFGHKFVAQHYGFMSEFRADIPMMLLAIVIAFFGFLFLAPGAVVIWGRISLRQNGIISVAGPLVNLALALIFIFLSLFVFPNATGLLSYILFLGIWINAFLGVFNMLPFWILDGKKVLAWNKGVYFSVMGSLISILVLSILGFF